MNYHWMILLSLAATRAWAGPLDPPETQEMLPPSGIGATTVGQRVILHPDGSWKEDKFKTDFEVLAVSDHGRIINLEGIKDPKTGKFKFQWHYTNQIDGEIQILVSRAIDTSRSAHSKDDNCIPVIKARNLTRLPVSRVVAELEFISGSGHVSSSSVMLGPLATGEEKDEIGSPLFVKNCQGLTAKLHVPYCRLNNGIDCTRMVGASGYSSIPITLRAIHQKPSLSKGKPHGPEGSPGQ